MNRIHFIAIGGSAMHNLALALHHSGYKVTGSDDEIRDPSYSRLKNAGLLPEKEGWFPEKIHTGLDAVILGMHAREDNPELLKAKELNLKIFSYPEFLYEASKNTLRVVVGGSHGKTTTTSMLLHALRKKGVAMNYLVGAQIEGFETMVHIHPESKISVFEGDEYLTSPIDRRPKFHLYKPHIAILTGIAWDHINVFPTFEDYVNQFRIYIDTLEKFATLLYDESDALLKRTVEEHPRKDIQKIPYGIPEHSRNENGMECVIYKNRRYPLQVFGDHNLKNLEAASLAWLALGYEKSEFWEMMTDFKGAAGRMEIWHAGSELIVIRDFAHSPSKVKSTVEAVRKQFPDYRLRAFFELHTFSSLNKEFIPQYHNTMSHADEAWVYFNPHTLEHKRMQPLSAEFVKECFGSKHVQVTSDHLELLSCITEIHGGKQVVLLMSSGDFHGLKKEKLLLQLGVEA
ncbi:MAG: Mur ligase family protein [Bacteroidia bacterium]|nr:Mur ligase family protein [Bacteroidia bacterium]